MDFPQGKGIREFNRLYKELDDLYHDLSLKMGLSDSAFIILYAICEMGDGCLQRDICLMSYLSKQTINSSIQKLEQGGYLVLKHGKGRDREIFLTDAGRRLAEEKILPVAQMENLAFEELSPAESRELLRLTGKYVERFRAKAKQIL